MGMRCKYYGKCGGCSWIETTLEEQLKAKEDKIKLLFGDSLPILPSPKTYYYRNRMDFSFGSNYAIGLKDYNNKVINIDDCLLMSKESNAILKRFHYFISIKKLKAYKEGIMRYLVVREGKRIKNTILNICTSEIDDFPLEDLWEKTQDLVQGVIWSISKSSAERSSAVVRRSLGQSYIMEELNGFKLKVPVQAFFQVNTLQAENLLKVVRSFADLKGDEVVFDLYAGVGSIGIFLAPYAKEVVGIEESSAAVETSKENADLNKVNNYIAISGSVENNLRRINKKPDLIILDPPRPGVTKKVLTSIGEIRPASIIYVSCNPETQKHDVNILEKYGYRIEKCQPLDMFPFTPHIENIALLVLK